MPKDRKVASVPSEDPPTATAMPSAKATTPAAALARHLEWLEYALTAAKDEESRRQGRLERATDRNRDRRSTKLAEVSAEVRELDALVRGIRELQARAARKSAGAATAGRAATEARTATAGSSPASPSRASRGTAKAAKADGRS